MYLQLDEVASALGVTVEVLRRWVAQGKIPAKFIDDEPVFSRDELARWTAERNLTPSVGSAPATTKARASLVAAMRVGGVHLDVGGDDKASVLDQVFARVSLPDGLERGELCRRVLEREQLASTGVGRGVAIPHARTPLEDFFGPPLVATCVLARAVDWGAIDGRPVTAVFLLHSPSVKSHLEILSQLSYCLRDDPFLELLGQRPATAQVLAGAEKALERLPARSR